MSITDMMPHDCHSQIAIKAYPAPSATDVEGCAEKNNHLCTKHKYLVTHLGNWKNCLGDLQ